MAVNGLAFIVPDCPSPKICLLSTLSSTRSYVARQSVPTVLQQVDKK